MSAKTPAEQANTNSIALFYLSVWKNTASAHTFARMYANDLGRKYSGVKLDEIAQASSASLPSGTVGPVGQEQVYSTNEGPVVITQRGKMVFVAESFPLDVARKLTTLILDAQGSGEMKFANSATPGGPGLASSGGLSLASETWGSKIGEPLTASFIRFFSSCGVMKAVVDAEIKAAER